MRHKMAQIFALKDQVFITQLYSPIMAAKLETNLYK